MSSPKKEAFLPVVRMCGGVRCAPVTCCVQPEVHSVPVFSRCTTLFHKSLTHCACPGDLFHSCAAFREQCAEKMNESVHASELLLEEHNSR